jgi:hypothetical protein
LDLGLITLPVDNDIRGLAIITTHASLLGCDILEIVSRSDMEGSSWTTFQYLISMVDSALLKCLDSCIFGVGIVQDFIIRIVSVSNKSLELIIIDADGTCI